MKTTLNLIAFEYGKIAFKKGLKCVPYQDKNLIDMIPKNSPVESSINLLKAWTAAWHKENMKG